MKLYFNGCSVTYGDELEHPELDAWPVLVAKHHAVDYTNDAVRGGSNDRIVRQTIINVDHYDKFYIQWTYVDRFMLTDTSNNWQVSFQRQLINHQYRNVDYYQTFGKYYYAHWSSPIQNYINWLTQIISLQSVFKLKNKPYVMFCNSNNIAKPFAHQFDFFTEESLCNCIKHSVDLSTIDSHCLTRQLNNLISNIDLTCFVDRNQFTADTMSYLEGGNFKLPGGHGDKKFHQLLAQKIIQHENI
jgi:hypothetical protein